MDFWCWLTRAVHLAKPRDVPEFRREVSAFLDLSFIEPNVLSRRRDAHQSKSQAVRAILIDQLERVGRIAERLRHFAALAVANDAGEENVVKRNVFFDLSGFPRLELEPGDDHARDPEKNDVRRGYEHTCRIEFLSCLRIHRLVSPQPR